jgi:hypothetical protein
MNFKRLATRSDASLKASFDVELPSGMILHECMLFIGSFGKIAWASPPAKAQINSRNQVMQDKSGNRLYEATVSFADRATELRWSASVLAVLTTGCPDLVTETHVEAAMEKYRHETSGLDRAGREHAAALRSIGVRAPIAEARRWQDGSGLRHFEDMLAEINGAST